MSSRLQDRIVQDFGTITESFMNVLKSAKVDLHPQNDAGSMKGTTPGALPDVYVERMLVAAENLLAINRELKQNALLNDCSLRRQLVEEEETRSVAQESPQGTDPGSALTPSTSS
ncbi:hypothetical protein ACKKBG_A22500 [Auxenochlorella protothecoides x Auxenochlorella symbiontica]